MLSHLRTEDNPCPTSTRVTVKCQEVQVDMDAVSLLQLQDGIRGRDRGRSRVMASPIMAMPAIKAKVQQSWHACTKIGGPTDDNAGASVREIVIVYDRGVALFSCLSSSRSSTESRPHLANL